MTVQRLEATEEWQAGCACGWASPAFAIVDHAITAEQVHLAGHAIDAEADYPEPRRCRDTPHAHVCEREPDHPKLHRCACGETWRNA